MVLFAGDADSALRSRLVSAGLSTWLVVSELYRRLGETDVLRGVRVCRLVSCAGEGRGARVSSGV